jgi:hypothetical protein
MNRRGNPKSLVASHPGNLNAAKQGVHSPRLIQERAAEIASELTQSFEFSPAERLAAHEAARCIAILEAIDRDLDQPAGPRSPARAVLTRRFPSWRGLLNLASSA